MNCILLIIQFIFSKLNIIFLVFLILQPCYAQNEINAIDNSGSIINSKDQNHLKEFKDIEIVKPENNIANPELKTPENNVANPELKTPENEMTLNPEEKNDLKNEMENEMAQKSILSFDNRTNKVSSDNFFSYELNGNIHYYQISGTDKNYNISQTILFKAVTLQEFGLTENWSPNLKTFQKMNYSVLQVSSSTAGINVYNSLNRIVNAIFGLKYDVIEKIYLKPEFQYGGLIAFRALNSKTTVIETILLPKLNATFGFHIFYTDHVEFNVYGVCNAIIPVQVPNYGSVNGFGYEFGPEFIFKKTEWSFNTSLYYNSFYLKTSPINLNYLEFGLRLGFALDL
ncbi:hypothetical protein ACWNT8_11075 [Pigmentibacter ruber]|uniref:hypothetical protein n=1 Tax=Pigmentibacter ruber TaxID=2683196 RepID=UPI00131E35D3|nr:hypothetical protein [Pigmentibacter ruber]